MIFIAKGLFDYLSCNLFFFCWIPGHIQDKIQDKTKYDSRTYHIPSACLRGEAPTERPWSSAAVVMCSGVRPGVRRVYFWKGRGVRHARAGGARRWAKQKYVFRQRFLRVPTPSSVLPATSSGASRYRTPVDIAKTTRGQTPGQNFQDKTKAKFIRRCADG